MTFRARIQGDRATAAALWRILDTAWLVLVVVLLIHGPEVSRLLVRASYLGVKSEEQAGALSPAGTVLSLEGVVDVESAYTCPPGWLGIAGVPNSREMNFAPVKLDDRLRAWVVIPPHFAARRGDGLAALPPLSSPIVRLGMESSAGFAPDDLERLITQVRVCPVRGEPSTLLPPEGRILLGELVATGSQARATLGDDVADLSKLLAPRWAVALLAILLFRRLPWRRRRPKSADPRIPSDTVSQARARVRRSGWALVLRTAVGALAVGAALAFGQDMSGVWERAAAANHDEEVQAGQLRYGRITGVSAANTALLCPASTLAQAGLSSGTGQRLVLFLQRMGKLPPALVSMPYKGPDDAMGYSLARHRDLAVHVHGYYLPIEEPVALRAHDDGCLPLAGKHEGAPAASVFFALDPYGPEVYRDELLGLLLLALLLGGSVGYLWTLLRNLVELRRERRRSVASQ